MKIVLLTHTERRALLVALAPESRFIDTTDSPTKGDVVILTSDPDQCIEPILRFRIG